MGQKFYNIGDRVLIGEAQDGDVKAHCQFITKVACTKYGVRSVAVAEVFIRSHTNGLLGTKVFWLISENVDRSEFEGTVPMTPGEAFAAVGDFMRGKNIPPNKVSGPAKYDDPRFRDTLAKIAKCTK